MNRILSRAAPFAFSKLRALSLSFSSTAFAATTNGSHLPPPPYPSPNLVDYLIKTCGFPSEIADRIPRSIRSSDCTANAGAVIDFLKRSGFTDAHVKKLVGRIPRVLGCRLEQDLKPKIEALQDLGLSGNGLADLIVTHRILERDLQKHILPSIAYLRTLLRSDKDVIRACKNSRWCLLTDVEKRAQPNLSILRQWGVSDSSLLKFMIRKPMLLTMSPDALEEIIKKAHAFGFEPGSGMLPHAIWAISSMNRATWDAKVELLKGFGLNDEDIQLAFKKCPTFISISESKMKETISFFMDKLNYNPSQVADASILLKRSMEKRIIPRYEVMKTLESKKILKRRWSFKTILLMNERDFCKKFVLKYKDDHPDLVNAYAVRMMAADLVSHEGGK